MCAKVKNKQNQPTKTPSRFISTTPRWPLRRTLPRCLSTPRRVAKKRNNGRLPRYGICPRGCWTRATWITTGWGLRLGFSLVVEVEGGWTFSSVRCCFGSDCLTKLFVSWGARCWCVWVKMRGACWSVMILVVLVMASPWNFCSTVLLQTYL